MQAIVYNCRRNGTSLLHEKNNYPRILDLARTHRLVRPRDITAQGLPRVALTRLARQGLLIRVGRGLYAIPGRAESEHGSLAEIGRKHPQAIVCLLSALRFHNLTTQAPFEVWLAIPNKARAPRMPRCTVVAEKLEALSSLGIANSRMKDYFDLWILARHTDFDGDILRQAVQATFDRRKSALSGKPPFGLTDAFAHDPQKQVQWQAFLRKNQLEALALNEVVAALADFMLPVIQAASVDAVFLFQWQAGGFWMPAELG